MFEIYEKAKQALAAAGGKGRVLWSSGSCSLLEVQKGMTQIKGIEDWGGFDYPFYIDGVLGPDGLRVRVKIEEVKDVVRSDST